MTEPDNLFVQPEAGDPADGSLSLTPPSSNPRAALTAAETDGKLRFTFADNAPILSRGSAEVAQAAIAAWATANKGASIKLETKVTDYAVSGAEAQRIAVERLLVFRGLLIDAGVSPSKIRVKTTDQETDVPQPNKSPDFDYGWVELRPQE
ncbi:hypothetical protein [Streptomyces erythrochromogenes]|uniref:hypothetical protein n=1 Tax=Streptomyces erythrochromogenes TaxID=285574 RepID=UPI00342AC178